MKRKSELVLKSETDIKVFLLFLLDNIGYPIEFEVLMSIVEENTNDISWDYTDCLGELVRSGHIVIDELDGDRYYSVTDMGHFVAAELYDTLDSGFRERSLRAAMQFISLSDSGGSIHSSITKTAEDRYSVNLVASDRFGERMNVSLTVNSRAEAEEIKKNFDNKPDGVYRGVLFAATGRMGYITK